MQDTARLPTALDHLRKAAEIKPADRKYTGAILRWESFVGWSVKRRNALDTF